MYQQVLIHMTVQHLPNLMLMFKLTARLLILGSFTDASMAMMSVTHSHLSSPTSAAADTQPPQHDGCCCEPKMTYYTTWHMRRDRRQGILKQMSVMRSHLSKANICSSSSKAASTA
jgi:hypothetical protein